MIVYISYHEAEVNINHLAETTVFQLVQLVPKEDKENKSLKGNAEKRDESSKEQDTRGFRGSRLGEDSSDWEADSCVQ